MSCCSSWVNHFAYSSFFFSSSSNLYVYSSAVDRGSACDLSLSVQQIQRQLETTEKERKKKDGRGHLFLTHSLTRSLSVLFSSSALSAPSTLSQSLGELKSLHSSVHLCLSGYVCTTDTDLIHWCICCIRFLFSLSSFTHFYETPEVHLVYHFHPDKMNECAFYLLFHMKAVNLREKKWRIEESELFEWTLWLVPRVEWWKCFKKSHLQSELWHYSSAYLYLVVRGNDRMNEMLCSWKRRKKKRKKKEWTKTVSDIFFHLSLSPHSPHPANWQMQMQTHLPSRSVRLTN